MAPEPSDDLDAVVSEAQSQGPVTVFAPWAWHRPLPAWLPARARAALARRQITAPGGVVSSLSWLALEAPVRQWAGDDTGRTMSARFALRRVVDTMAARWLPPSTTAVFAPSCGAERTFAVAAARGCATTLVEDLPSLRRLHADLDRAARVHPGCGFLRRYRAPADAVARQEVERVLATLIRVRGAYARDALLEAGIPSDRLVAPAATVSPRPMRRPSERPPRTALLAGLATARNGTNEALALLTRDADLSLLVRAGEGSEPTALLAHPRVRPSTAEERASLAGVDAVLALAWCESYPRELARAAELGLSAVATRQAAGFVACTRLVEAGEVPPPGWWEPT